MLAFSISQANFKFHLIDVFFILRLQEVKIQRWRLESIRFESYLRHQSIIIQVDDACGIALELIDTRNERPVTLRLIDFLVFGSLIHISSPEVPNLRRLVSTYSIYVRCTSTNVILTVRQENHTFIVHVPVNVRSTILIILQGQI